MRDVAGKVAFVTGGSSGIGLGIAQAFVDAGMKVAIGYRTPAHLEHALQSLHGARERVLPIEVDVADRPGLEAAVAKVVGAFGKVHVLASNAGVTHPAPASQTSYDDWDWLMSVNVDGVFNSVRAFLPAIRSHGEGGHVVATSSILGLLAVGNYGAYTASKFAVVGLMEALRAELVPENIGVSVFCPGPVDTNIADAARNNPNAPDRTRLQREPNKSFQSMSVRRNPPLTRDPVEAGRAVLRGMLNNDLYILTHPEHAQVLRERSEALLGALPSSTRITNQRLAAAHSELYTPIYAIERDRRESNQ